MTVRMLEVDEARMRQMLAHLPFFASVVDEQGRFLWVNRIDPTLSADQVIGVKVETYVVDEHKPRVRDALARAFETGEVGYYEVRGYGQGELETWFGTNVVPLPDDGAGRQALLLSQDVTAKIVAEREISSRALAEERLQVSEARLRLALEAANISFWEWDLAEDRVVVTDAYRQAARTEPAVPMADFLASAHPDDRPTIEDHIRRLAAGAQASFQNEFRTADGERWFLSTGKVVERGDGGAATRVLGASLDITQQKRDAQETAALREQLWQAQKTETLGKFAGGVAHDFNNLLMVILGNLRAYGADGDRERLAAAEAAAVHAGELTRSLLAFSRRQPHDPQERSLQEIVRATITMIGPVMPSSMKLELDLPDEPQWVLADVGQLQQVLTNLCLNARDATGGGGTARIAVAPTPGDASRPSGVVLSVTDDGPGVPPDLRVHIFDPFVSTKPEGEGTGLGLAVAHGIVTQHGGTIAVHDAPRGGARFEVWLPLCPAPDDTLDTPGAPGPVPRNGSMRPRVLLADDNGDVRSLVAMLLRRTGFDVVEASDGAEAIRLGQEQRFDAAVLDIVMPGATGPEVYAAIADQGRPAVVYSTGDLEPLASHPGLKGARILVKPYRLEALVAALSAALAEPDQRPESANGTGSSPWATR